MSENQKDKGLEHKTERIMVVSEKRKAHVGERKTETHNGDRTTERILRGTKSRKTLSGNVDTDSGDMKTHCRDRKTDGGDRTIKRHRLGREK